MRGMTVNVFRTKHCCTNGETARRNDVMLINNPHSIVCEVPEIVRTSGTNIFGTAYAYPTFFAVRREKYDDVIAYPSDVDLALVERSYHPGYMFGGNFLYSSDSRFPSRSAIKVHDRHESRPFDEDTFGIYDVGAHEPTTGEAGRVVLNVRVEELPGVKHMLRLEFPGFDINTRMTEDI